MIKSITKLLAILFVTLVSAQQKPTLKPITVTLGKQYNMPSKILKEERVLLIHTPVGYADSDKKYPVVYILDGNGHFSHAVNAATLLADNGRMPESIIVGIPNNRGTRRRDLGRSRDNFKKYIKEEVIPFVNNNYKASNHKTLFGHSMAGAFTLNFLASEPTLFDAHIAASPVVQIFNSELLDKFSTLFKNNKALSKPVYFTLGNATAEGARVTEAMNKFVNLLEKEAPKNFYWKYDYMANQIHMTTPYLTMYKGFTEVFHDYQAPRFNTYKEYVDKGEMKYLKAYYATRAKKYNTKNVIAERTMSRLANMLIREKQEKIGLELLILNTKNHPNSMPALNGLARTYVGLKQPKKAIEIYKAALKIAENQNSPNSAYFKRQLKSLEE